MEGKMRNSGKTNITVVINTYNEEKNIAECIESAKLLSEDIIIVDTQSTDRTQAIVRKSRIKIYPFPYSRFVEVSRKFSIEKAEGPWVFLLDADERITREMVQEILHTLSTTTHAFFKVPRKTYFAGHWLRYGAWYPDYVIKLLNKKAFVNWPEQIHTAPNIKGSCGLLNEPLDHLSQPNLSHMVKRTIVYEDVESNLLFKDNVSVNNLTLFRKFFGELYRRLIMKQGFRDGVHGIIESIYQAYSKTITYIYLYEKYQQKGASV